MGKQELAEGLAEIRELDAVLKKHMQIAVGDVVYVRELPNMRGQCFVASETGQVTFGVSIDCFSFLVDSDDKENDENTDEIATAMEVVDRKMTRAEKEDEDPRAKKFLALTKPVKLFAKSKPAPVPEGADSTLPTGVSRCVADRGRATPFDMKDDLKGLRFRWDAAEKVWYRNIQDEEIDIMTETLAELGLRLRVVV